LKGLKSNSRSFNPQEISPESKDSPSQQFFRAETALPPAENYHLGGIVSAPSRHRKPCIRNNKASRFVEGANQIQVIMILGDYQGQEFRAGVWANGWFL